MSGFKKFYDRKVEEITTRQQSFDEAKVFGAYPHSSRQPAAFHYYLTLLERFTPEASKAEILFEAVRSAYDEVVTPLREEMTDPVREVCDHVYAMVYQAYSYKCGKSQSEIGDGGGFSVTDEAKSLADEFLSDFDSGGYTHADLIAKYQGTLVDPHRNNLGDYEA